MSEPDTLNASQLENNDSGPSKSAPHPIHKRIHWKTGAGIVLGGGIVQTVLWNLWEGDATYQIFSIWYTWMTVGLLLLLWWVAISGFRWKVRLTGVSIVVALLAFFFSLFRFEEMSGDFRPRFAFRWTETAEDRADEFRRSQNKSSTTPQAPPTKTATSPARLDFTEEDWPHFRGPNCDGIVRGVHLRTDWKTNPPVELWRHPIGLGWSSFAIIDRYVFTQEQRRQEEAVVCYDFETGRELWSHTDPVRFSSLMGGDGPRGTPTLYDSKLYTIGGTGILNCLDPLTGSVIWSRNTVADAGGTTAPPWGMSGSPLVYEDLVVVNPGGQQNRGVAAYHRLTGKKMWASGNHAAGYAAPRLATLDGLEQILIFDADGLGGYHWQTGKELWRIAWPNHTKNNITQPIVYTSNTVFISSGYAAGSALIRVKQTEGGWLADSVWERPNQFKLKFNGGVYREDHVYGLDEGILSCFDLKKGKRRWKRGRYRYGQLLLFDNVLLISTESGELVLADISPQGMNEIARFQALHGKTWNHPVYHRGRLLIRNAEEAACFDLR